MISKNQRTFTSFTQLLNSKNDTSIQYGWIKKISHRGNQESRFVVATKSALFICKSSGIIRTLRIAHIYGWIDLSLVKMESKTTFNFVFQNNESVSFVYDDAIHFITPIISHLRSLLPSEHQVKYELPKEIQVDHISHRPSQFIHLFISACRSSDAPINENLCSNFRKGLFQHNLLTFIQNGNYDIKIINAFNRALSLTRKTPKVIIGGNNYQELYLSLSNILKENQSIYELTIQTYHSSNGFSQFINSLQFSKLTSLSFEYVQFTNEMVQYLTEHIPVDFKSLTFLNSNFESEQFTQLNNVFKKNIKEINICKDDQPMPFDVIPDFFKAAVQSRLSSLSLSYMNIDIASIFTLLNGMDIQLEELDLKGNFCSSIFTGNYNISSSLTTINLKSVLWEENTFIMFLSLQVFTSQVSINLSRASFKRDKFKIFEDLPESPPTPMISKLKWNHNPISSNILLFIEKYSFLDDVSFNHCEVADNDNILSTFCRFLEKTHLTRFSVVATLNKYKTQMMFALRSPLMFHPNLSRLNISENEIGDEGLPVLRDVILQSESIVQISFDSSGIQQPISMIQFLNEISSSHLLHVSKPRNDFQHLLSKSPKNIQKELKDAWINLESKLKKNKEIAGVNNMNEPSLNSTINSAFIDSTSMMDTGPITRIEASWKMSIDIGYDGSEDIWNQLKSEYSLSSITGIQNTNKKDDNQIDLIEFD